MNCALGPAVDFACAALCDAAHACPAGTSCMAVAGLTNGGGLCQ